ncbi:hypothetical protein ACSLOS_08780, partial [Klebsiella pneumoniae]
DTPEMKAYLQQDPRAAIALEQLKYAHPWYSTWETVAVRKAMDSTARCSLAGSIATPSSKSLLFSRIKPSARCRSAAPAW